MCLEEWSLLDVEFDESVRRNTWAWRHSRVANPFKFVAKSSPIDADGVQRLFHSESPDVDEGSEHVRSEARPFLVGEDGDAEWSIRCDACLLACLDHFKTSEDAIVSVIDSTGANRVDVRTGHHGQTGPDIPDAKDVADRVDGDRHPEIFHPSANEIASEAVLVGEGESARPAGLRRTYLCQSVDPGAKSRHRDAE